MFSYYSTRAKQVPIYANLDVELDGSANKCVEDGMKIEAEYQEDVGSEIQRKYGVLGFR